MDNNRSFTLILANDLRVEFYHSATGDWLEVYAPEASEPVARIALPARRLLSTAEWLLRQPYDHWEAVLDKLYLHLRC